MPNIEDIQNRINMDNLRQIFFVIFISACLLLIPYVHIAIIIGIDVTLIIVYLLSAKNKKSLQVLAKLNELLVYRKPTEKQVEAVLFGFGYLEACKKDTALVK